MVMIFTFQGHTRLSVIWSFDSLYGIFYRCSIGTNVLYWTIFKI